MPLSLFFQSPPPPPLARFPTTNPKSGNLACALNIKLAHLQSDVERPRGTRSVTSYKTCRPDMLLEVSGVHSRHVPLERFKGISMLNSTTTSTAIGRCFSSLGKNDQEVVEVEDSTPKKDQIRPGSLEVESLITAICDTTSIAEVKLELGGFQLYVKRGIAENNVASPILSLPPVQTTTSNPISQSNGSAATTSLVLSKPTPITSVQRIIETASDEGLVIIQSPKVGLFRRSRTIKGKRAPPSCKEKQEVKEGQVLCYIEQLAGEIPIESDATGEVIKILREDGEPVGYGDALIAILPSFAGIKLQ